MTTTDEKQDRSESRTNEKFDLEERTAVFGEAVIRFAKTIPRTAVTNPLITQLVKAATSIGANYCETDDAESPRDFRHKIGICRKESRETKHWFRMVAAAEGSLCEGARPLWSEAKQLHLIFSKIRRNTKV